MPRLIDADSIKSAKYHDLPYTHIHPVGVDVQAYEMGWNDALDAVADSAPTVDAEPVVRCKDCRYCTTNTTVMTTQTLVHCNAHRIMTEWDGYCHKGERR